MSRNDRLDDVALRALAAGCPNLRVIKLSQCVKVADAGVIDLASNCKRLEVIDLSNCPKVCEFGDHPLLKISQCKHLRELNVMGCPQIRGIGLEAVARGCSHLSTLRVSRCVAGMRDDQGARALMNHCSNLETLVLIDWSILRNKHVKGAIFKKKIPTSQNKFKNHLEENLLEPNPSQIRCL